MTGLQAAAIDDLGDPGTPVDETQVVNDGDARFSIVAAGEAKVSSAAVLVSPTAATSSYVIQCDGTVDQVHYSSGAGGAIAKARIKCKSTSSVVTSATVHLECVIGLSTTSTAGPWVVRAASGYSQSVQTGFNNWGASKTYYCPHQSGANAGRGTGYWKASFAGSITSPGQFANVAGGTSITPWKTI